MHRTAILNARLILAGAVREGGLLIEGSRIEAVLPAGQTAPPDAVQIDARGQFVGPGLIDAHVHGGGGFNLMSDDPEQILAYARWVAGRGVTGFLISTCGADHADIVRRLRALASVVGPVPGGARVLGFHLEGPYINPVRKGAFPPRWLRAPSVAEYHELLEASGGHIVQMTLAPELPGALELIDAVVASGAVAAIGHTDATYEEAMAAIERGASHATHCFNAMRPFGHRDPGVLGAVMTSDAVTAELIGDGAHVEYPAAEVLVRSKGPQHIVLITDAMPMAGTPDGDGDWEGQLIRVDGGKAVRVADGTIIGGVITLDQTVRNAVQHLGVSVAEAWAMASTNPARAMKCNDRVGALAPGLAADFTLLDDELRVAETWINGERGDASIAS
jgi:N-acetylglucosamine-6-phosphate deacetylase